MKDFNSRKEAFLDDYIPLALAEDIGPGDYTSQACIHPAARCKAHLLVKDVGVLAGVEVAEAFFKSQDPDCHFDNKIPDGTPIRYGDIAFEVECNTQILLRLERTVLNTMQRMSGIATQANRFAFEVEDLPVKILDTRKTTPLLRFLEKWAVHLGGCYNYRSGLYDWFMIKDNHIDACGGIRQAIEKVAAYQKEKNLKLGVTVEVRNLNELDLVMATGKVTRIMFDNFEAPLLKTAVEIVNKLYETEASGGINIHNIRKMAQTGVEYISVGALTHSAQSLDLSLKVIE